MPKEVRTPVPPLRTASLPRPAFALAAAGVAAYAVAHAVEGAVFPEHPECTYDEGAPPDKVSIKEGALLTLS